MQYICKLLINAIMQVKPKTSAFEVEKNKGVSGIQNKL